MLTSPQFQQIHESIPAMPRGCLERWLVPRPNNRGITEYKSMAPAANLFRMLDKMFKNNTLTWTYAFQLRADLELSVYTQQEEQRCPLVFVIVHLASVYISLRTETVSNGRSAMARMLRMAWSAREIIIQSSTMNLDAWQRLLETRFRALQRAPGQIWHELGCASVPHAWRTLSNLLKSPPRIHEIECFRQQAIFSPREFFDQAQSPNPLSLYDALYNSLAVRPIPWHQLYHLHMIRMVLADHLVHLHSVSGLILEFGVYQAKSLNLIAEHVLTIWQKAGMPGQAPQVFGFDSFQGLPRDWGDIRAGEDSVYGLFAPLHAVLPSANANVQFVAGWFNETLKTFLGNLPRVALGQTPIVSLVHLDADLYESTQLVLELLLPFLGEGSILIFDDLFHFPKGLDVLSTETQEASKENWNALFETLQNAKWTWKLEVLAAPWHLPATSGTSAKLSAGAAFRLID